MFVRHSVGCMCNTTNVCLKNDVFIIDKKNIIMELRRIIGPRR